MHPASAPARTILPEHSRASQPLPITAPKKRCDYRREVIRDKRLSPWARLLYVELDDRAGMKAEAWPRQQILADVFSVHRQRINEWVQELVAAGYVKTVRTGRSSHYFPGWCDVLDSGHQMSAIPDIGWHVSINEPEKQPEQQQQAVVVDPQFAGILEEVFGVINSI